MIDGIKAPYYLWRSTCTVPSHPKKCPECGHRIKIFHLNLKGDAIFMCTNTSKCNWPLKHLKYEDFSGYSDFDLHYRWQRWKRRLLRKKLNPQDNSSESSSDDAEDVASSECFSEEEEEEEKASSRSGDQEVQCPQLPPAQRDKISDVIITNSYAQSGKEPSFLPVKHIRNAKKTETSSSMIADESVLNQLDIEPIPHRVPEKDVFKTPENFNTPSPIKEMPNSCIFTSPTRRVEGVDEEIDAIMGYMRVPPKTSPFTPSPCHSMPSPRLSMSPLRESDLEFQRATPTSVPGSPWSLNRTPFHLPTMLSPLPMTPRAAKTPDYDPNFGDELHNLSSPPQTDQIRNHINVKDQETAEKLPTLSLEKESNTSSWSINSACSSLTSGQKLDKVVLSLKKTAGNNWNVRDVESHKPKINHSMGGIGCDARSKKRGRKSKSAPVKKIQNIAVNTSFATEANSKIIEAALSEPPIKVKPIKSSNNSKLKMEAKRHPKASNSNQPIFKHPSVKPEKKTLDSLKLKKQKIEPKSSTNIKPKPDLPLRSVFRNSNKKLQSKKRIEVAVDSKSVSKLKNKLAMTLGLPINISVGENNSENTMKQIVDITKTAPCHKAENAEFRKLLDGMGDKKYLSDEETMKFIQELQQKLLKPEANQDPKVVTFHVGHNKATIDLPVETLDVTSQKKTTVKLLLYSESDGIEGDILKADPKLPANNSKQFLKKRGNSRRERSPSPPPTMVPTSSRTLAKGPYRFPLPKDLSSDNGYVNHESQQQEESEYYSYFRDQNNWLVFNGMISNLMHGYYFPEPYRERDIDPVFAMLFSRMNDPTNTPEISMNYKRLMEIYANFCRLGPPNGNEDVNLQRHEDPGNISAHNQTTSRTYTELQPVRGRENASDVLREHQTSSGNENSTTIPISKKSKSENQRPRESSSSLKNDQCGKNVKTEIVLELPPSVQTVGSVSMTSVCPGERSVLEVGPNLPAKGYIGTGQRAVTIPYRNGIIGPIRVDTEEEVKALADLVEDHVIKSQSRGQELSVDTKYFAAAERARSILSPEVIKYVQKSFTQKGMKENILGRKKRNYPKRSAIIKIDPQTGEKLIPNSKDPSLIVRIKKECLEAPPNSKSAEGKESRIESEMAEENPGDKVIQRRVKTMLLLSEPQSSLPGMKRKMEESLDCPDKRHFKSSAAEKEAADTGSSISVVTRSKKGTESQISKCVAVEGVAGSVSVPSTSRTPIVVKLPSSNLASLSSNPGLDLSMPDFSL